MPSATGLSFALRSARENDFAPRFSSLDASGGKIITLDLERNNAATGTKFTKLLLVITLATILAANFLGC